MWYQLQIESAHHDEVEQLSNILEEMGSLSITLTDKCDNPVLEPAPGTTPLWPDLVITALYSEEKQALQAQHQLTCLYPCIPSTVNHLENQDWERAWMDNFKPQCFGQHLWICPSWITPPKLEAINVVLDPGLAFGTGTHPTTKLCLHWLGDTFDTMKLQGKTVIDYGCGSGILGIAALKLGAKFLYAIDIDPQALEATQNNAITNHISHQQLAIYSPELLSDIAPADVIIANILLTPLMTLQDNFHHLLKNNGILVVSGILTTQVPILIEAYQKKFIHHDTYESDGWSLLVFIRC